MSNNRAFILDSISEILVRHGISFEFKDPLFVCSGFRVLPVFKDSDFDVESKLEVPITRLVLETMARRDLWQLDSRLRTKLTVREGFTVECHERTDAHIPTFVYESFSNPEIRDPNSYDVNIMYGGRCILWARFILNYISPENILFRRIVGHPDYFLYGSITRTINAVLEQLKNVKSVFTFVHTRHNSYHDVGFYQVAKGTYSGWGKADPNLDVEYKCGDKIPLYLLRYDRNRTP